VGQYVTFLLDLAANGEDRTIADSLALAPSTMLPANGFQWKVICDGEGKVFVIASHGRGCEVIAMARHRDGDVVQRLQQEHTRVPTAFQWKLVREALRANVAKLPDPPSDETALDVNDTIQAHRPRKRGVRYVAPPEEIPSRIDTLPRAKPQRAWVWKVLIAMTALAIPVAILVLVKAMTASPATTTPAPPRPAARAPETPRPTPGTPPPAQVDPVAQASTTMRWSDVADAHETSIAYVLKDWEAERGKKLCMTGTIESIERRDVDRRKTFVGRFVTSEGDRVDFVAVGSTGILVRGSRGTLCGVVTGKLAVLGMFDVPENQLPVVEQ
jgi:hypothetical protein